MNNLEFISLHIFKVANTGLPLELLQNINSNEPDIRKMLEENIGLSLLNIVAQNAQNLAIARSVAKDAASKRNSSMSNENYADYQEKMKDAREFVEKYRDQKIKFNKAENHGN